MKRLSMGFVLATAALVATGCVSRSEIEEIKKNQEKILAKLDTVKAAPSAAARQRPRGPDPKKVYSFPVGEANIKGPDDAWVTVIEVSDFQCPYCKRVTPTLTQVAKKYGDDVRFAFKHNALPFHNRAKPAARASECAGEQGKFWEMHDVLFENQRQLEDSNFEEYAKKVGVNVAKWKSCYTSNKFDKRIDADQKLANSLGARGTPAFFINGRFLSGAQPLQSFTALIDEELKKAKASGIPKGQYYEKAVVAKGQKQM